MKPTSPQREAAVEILREFPDAATNTLAKTLYKRAPSLWRDAETARGYLRKIRGASGDEGRKAQADKSFYRPLKAPGDPFGRLPDPLPTVEKWNPVRIPGPLRASVLSDVHIPYHDKSALLAALQESKRRDANLLLLNGDFGDFFWGSFWETDPRNRKFKDELKQQLECLSIIRRGFPDARIIYKLGNHEERYIRYMRTKCPEFLGVKHFNFETVFQFKKFGVECVKDRSPVYLGALPFLHGHEYRFAISNPVSPARGLSLRAKTSAVCSHFHQPSHHPGKRLDDHVNSCWSTGCLCDMHPQFMPYNEWCHGFMFLEVDKDGAFSVDNLRIIDGKIWH